MANRTTNLTVALDAGCAVLFSEDLPAGRRFGELEGVNPFVDTAHEAGTSYRVGVKRARRR